MSSTVVAVDWRDHMKAAEVTVLCLSPLRSLWNAKAFTPLELMMNYHDLVMLAFCHDDVTELWQLIDQSDEQYVPVHVLVDVDDRLRQFLDHVNRVYVPMLAGGKDKHSPIKVNDRDAYFKRID